MAFKYGPLDLVFQPKDIESSVLQTLIDYDFKIDHACGGMGSCGTCRIFIDHNVELLPLRNPVEAERAKERGFAPNERLACQLMADREFQFHLPKDRCNS